MLSVSIRAPKRRGDVLCDTNVLWIRCHWGSFAFPTVADQFNIKMLVTSQLVGVFLLRGTKISVSV